LGHLKTAAVIFPEPGRVVVDEVDIPEPSSGDVTVEIDKSSISNGTERWCLTGKLTVPDKPPLAFPHVPGYQAAGTVIDVGRDVKQLQPGDRVFSRNCREPQGWTGSWWGGHTAIHVTAAASVIQIPPQVSTLKASALLIAQVGYNGATKPPLSGGEVSAVIGDGLVGQFAAQVLRHRGSRVILSGLSALRLEKAARFSAHETFNSTEGDFPSFVKGRFPDGVDLVVETASSASTIRQAVELLKYGGHLVLNGFYPPPESTLDWHWLRTKELTTYCPNSRTRERLEATLRLIAGGSVKVKELITHEIEYTDAPQAYEMLLDPEAEFLGIVLNWNA